MFDGALAQVWSLADSTKLDYTQFVQWADTLFCQYLVL